MGIGMEIWGFGQRAAGNKNAASKTDVNVPSRDEWSVCSEKLRLYLKDRNYRGSLNEKVTELTSYMDKRFDTQFNLTFVNEKKWIGPSCEDCEEYECSESQFVSCEMGTYQVDSYLTRFGKHIKFEEISKLLSEKEKERALKKKS
ncbi:MAG: hypothetical protein FWE54_07250 [Methanimicrococcus sp.]|nr:hypothetical protein [Methanimicrococcus sp.]